MNTRFAWVALVLLLAAEGCSSSSGTNDGTTPTVGSIGGTVRAIAADGQSSFFLSDAVVSIENTSLQALTDTNGHWQIKGVAPGTYNIRCEKTGYGYVRQFGFQFNGYGSTELGRFVLAESPKSGFHLDSVHNYSISTTCYCRRADLAGLDFPALFVIGRRHEIDPLDSSLVHIAYHFPATNPTFASSYLHDGGFKRGDTAYLCAYAIAYAYDFSQETADRSVIGSSFYNPYSDSYIYTSFSPPSEVVQFIVQ